MLVDIEYSSRKSNRLKRLIKNASFDQPEASVVDIDYTSGRKLNKDLILRLATCDYITEYLNVFITGATGSGKSYLACALGMEACKHFYNTKYVRMPDLLLDLKMAREENHQPSFAHSTARKDGMINLVAVHLHLQMQSWIA
jgi:DNA replication protein DnaC